MQSENYIVTNLDGLNVRAQMNSKNPQNLKRHMSANEGFVVYETYVQNGNETWGRVSNNPGGLQQEFACLSIGNRVFAKPQTDSDTPANATLEQRFNRLEAWARIQGYKG